MTYASKSLKLIPYADLILIASACWPFLVILNWLFGNHASFDFWQVYYFTLPHRWLTLALIAIDPDRRKGLGWWLPSAFVVFFIAVALPLATSGTLLCLALVDYVWNAWHFGSQHGGIARIYGIKSGQNRPYFDKWGFRILVPYALLRPVEWTFGWVLDGSIADTVLLTTDFLAIGLAITITLAAVIPSPARTLSRVGYIVSMCSLYSGLIVATRMGNAKLVASMLTASALMHAMEYIAFVSVYAMSRIDKGGDGPIRRIASEWIPVAIFYLILLGTFGMLIDADPAYAWYWGTVNLWVAFLHYWLDGMIWRLRDSGLSKGMTASI